MEHIRLMRMQLLLDLNCLKLGCGDESLAEMSQVVENVGDEKLA